MDKYEIFLDVKHFLGPVVFWNVALHVALYHATAVGYLSGIWFRLIVYFSFWMRWRWYTLICILPKCFKNKVKWSFYLKTGAERLGCLKSLKKENTWIQWFWGSLTYYWSYDSVHEPRCGKKGMGYFHHWGLSVKPLWDFAPPYHVTYWLIWGKVTLRTTFKGDNPH